MSKIPTALITAFYVLLLVVCAVFGIASTPAHAAGGDTDNRECVTLRESRLSKVTEGPGLRQRHLEKRWEVLGQGERVTAITIAGYPIIAYRWCDGVPGDWIGVSYDENGRSNGVWWHRVREDVGEWDWPFDGEGQS